MKPSCDTLNTYVDFHLDDMIRFRCEADNLDGLSVSGNEALFGERMYKSLFTAPCN